MNRVKKIALSKPFLIAAGVVLFYTLAGFFLVPWLVRHYVPKIVQEQIGVVISSILYAAMGVGADAKQRRMGIPSSAIFIVQSLIVLFILASDFFRYYRVNLPWLRKGPQENPSIPPA